MDVTVSESNIGEARERFAGFAELAADAPLQEAYAALDDLMRKLAKDEVSYYVYEEWMEAAFYNMHSPTRSAPLFDHIAARIESDGIMKDMLDRVALLRRYNSLNLEGQQCTLPQLFTPDGTPAEVSGPATVLVVDQTCRTCISALGALASEGGRHLAICASNGDIPSAPGWEYFRAQALSDIFDTAALPFWFAIDASGTVTVPYSPIPQQKFATPQ